MSNPDSPVLSVRNLGISFAAPGGWTSVVRNVSFDLRKKQTLAIVGESGSGKSVTALSLMGLLPERTSRITGEILLAGQAIQGMSEPELRAIRGRDIAMIFQEPMTSLNPVLTIGFQIAEAIMLHSGVSRTEADRRALAMLERVRVPAAARRMNNYPFEFSGGMRQRVMIALALACNPKVLVADEPTTALDVTIQAEILQLIKSLQEEEEMSVLFITHDMGVVAEMADDVLVMWRGDQIEARATDDLLRAPGQQYTRALLAAVPKLGAMKGRSAPLPFPDIDMETGAVTAAPARRDTVDPASATLLEVSDLRKSFPIKAGFFGRASQEVRAVQGVSFGVRAGETLAIVGESGCGKSTLGRCLIRLQEPTGGSVRFRGQDILTQPRTELQKTRQRIQMIFQDPFASLNPRRRIGAALAEPMLVHGKAGRAEAADRVSELLEKVGLSREAARRYPHEFSGGQRQRLCIARALALGPELIIADEAVSALDVTVKSQVVNLLMRLQEEMGMAYIFISHDMAVVERISHRVAVMYLGEIVEIGPRLSVIEDPQHPYTRKLMSAIPVPEPGQRHIRRNLSQTEIPSPIRPVDFVQPERRWRKVGEDHYVLESTD